MKTFRIVENAPPRFLDDYEEFVVLYEYSHLTVNDIRKRLDWNEKDYKKARRMALDKDDISNPRPCLSIRRRNNLNIR